MFLEVGQGNDLQCSFVGRSQDYGGTDPGIMSTLPIRRGDTPPITRGQAGKVVHRHRRDQIVTYAALMIEELRSDHGTHSMAPQILGAGPAVAVAIEPGEGVGTTGLELCAEDIPVGHRGKYGGLLGMPPSHALNPKFRRLRQTKPAAMEGSLAARTVFGLATYR